MPWERCGANSSGHPEKPRPRAGPKLRNKGPGSDVDTTWCSWPRLAQVWRLKGPEPVRSDGIWILKTGTLAQVGAKSAKCVSSTSGPSTPRLGRNSQRPSLQTSSSGAFPDRPLLRLMGVQKPWLCEGQQILLYSGLDRADKESSGSPNTPTTRCLRDPKHAWPIPSFEPGLLREVGPEWTLVAQLVAKWGLPARIRAKVASTGMPRQGAMACPGPVCPSTSNSWLLRNSVSTVNSGASGRCAFFLGETEISRSADDAHGVRCAGQMCASAGHTSLGFRPAPRSFCLPGSGPPRWAPERGPWRRPSRTSL